MQRVGRVVRKRKRATDDPTQLQESLLQCAFTEMPRVSPAELAMLYDRECITWDTYRRLACSSAGIRYDDMSTQRETWSHEDRKALLGGAVSRRSLLNSGAGDEGNNVDATTTSNQ